MREIFAINIDGIEYLNNILPGKPFNIEIVNPHLGPSDIFNRDDIIILENKVNNVTIITSFISIQGDHLILKKELECTNYVGLTESYSTGYLKVNKGDFYSFMHNLIDGYTQNVDDNNTDNNIHCILNDGSIIGFLKKVIQFLKSNDSNLEILLHDAKVKDKSIYIGDFKIGINSLEINRDSDVDNDVFWTKDESKYFLNKEQSTDGLKKFAKYFNQIYNGIYEIVIDEQNRNYSLLQIGIARKEYDIFINAIKTKPFLILAGISGTGKSRKVKELAYMSCPIELQDERGAHPGNYLMLEVKPNWHDSTELLGYYSNIAKEFLLTEFDKFVIKAWQNPKTPFFVCLDEMNLAPIEQYFAEFLSIIESRTRSNDNKEIVSEALLPKDLFGEYNNGYNECPIYSKLGLKNEEKDIAIKKYLHENGLTMPPNLIIIGTVNMDETTYQFSRKVIDRAMTIEMNGGNLEKMYGHPELMTYNESPISIDFFESEFINADEVINKYTDYAEKIKDNSIIGLPFRLNSINSILSDTPFKVSYRVLNEMTIYLGVLLDDSKNRKMEITDDKFEELIKSAVDNIMLMKILPRIEGDEDVFKVSEGKNKLEQLKDLCEDNYEKSFAKLDEMCKRLDNTGFTRFWP